MKQTLDDVHQQFADFFPGEILKPYAYLVSKKLSEGHICFDTSEITAEINGLPVVYQHLLPVGSNRLKDEKLVAPADGMQPFILHNNRLYLQRYFAYETAILKRIHSFIKSEHEVYNERCNILLQQEELITNLFEHTSQPDEQMPSTEMNWQLAGVLLGFINNFTIITGGPGTGKTTTLAKLLSVLYSIDPEMKVALAAPTGKAAMRMAESLSSARLNVPDIINEKLKALEPLTLHRLLGYIPDSPYFRHNTLNPLFQDVVVVDEASMIDVALFAKLMSAIGPQTRLILLGDKNQLASVEAGSMLGDLCQEPDTVNMVTATRVFPINGLFTNEKLKVSIQATENEHPMAGHIIELKKSYRFTDTSRIGKLSRAILTADLTMINTFIHNSEDAGVVLDTTYGKALFEDFIIGYEAYIKERDIAVAILKFNELRILCAVRDGDQGIYRINNLVEEYLQAKHLLKTNSDFYENRPVMITKNYYELGLFNGDTGIVRPDENGALKVWFTNSNGELRSILPGYITEVETVFAMTVHKSQGSEYDRVLVILPAKGIARLINRELLYTAVTRAKHQVLIQAGEETLFAAIKESVQRASGINERFKEILQTNPIN